MRGTKKGLSWSDPAKGSVVVAHLGKLLGLDESGAVTLGVGPDFDRACSVLASLAGFDRAIPEQRRTALARQAVVNLKKQDRLSVEGVAGELAQLQRGYLSTRPAPYLLLTSMSIRHTPLLHSRQVRGCLVSFSPYRHRRFKYPETLREHSGHHGDPPIGYSTVLVRVKARDATDAVPAALDSLDLLRGVWNFFLNFRGWRISLGGLGHAPVNPIVLGPIHTLHHPNGSPALAAHWWEPSYIQQVTPVELRDRLRRLRNFERWCKDRLAHPRLGDALSAILLRYVRALDDRFLNASFLKLWGVLEALTDTSNRSHEVTVRRASVFFRPLAFRRISLDQLREWRNRIAHEGAESPDPEQMVYELKVYVDVLLRYLLRHVRDFHSVSEFGEFLDLPTDAGILEDRARKLALARRLHKN